METAEIKRLLEKYWLADSSLEEEAQLAAYFRQPDIAVEFESVRELFAWREEETQVKPGEDFDQRLLLRLAASGAEAEGASRVEELLRVEEVSRVEGASRVERASARRGGVLRGLGFPVRFAAAAAIILCLGLGWLISVTSRGVVARGGKMAGVAAEEMRGVTAEQVAGATAGVPGSAIKDTYTDPRQALAAVQKALVFASVRINEGEHFTQKNITRLHKSWEVAAGD
jgi:hypothetical protein